MFSMMEIQTHNLNKGTKNVIQGVKMLSQKHIRKSKISNKGDSFIEKEVT